MIDAELKKTIKKDPVVEYIIPKRIFTTAPGNNGLSTNGDERVSENTIIANPTDPTNLTHAHGDDDTLTALWAF